MVPDNRSTSLEALLVSCRLHKSVGVLMTKSQNQEGKLVYMSVESDHQISNEYLEDINKY